jgi:hypothetical protein
MATIPQNVKRVFKVYLDSNKTTSFSGNQFDATYIVDLTKVLTVDADFDKTYNMSFAFRSRSGNGATTGLNMNDVYSLNLELGKGFNTYTANMNRNAVGIIPINNDFTAYTSTACPSFWDAKDSDNAPITVKNVRNVNTIRLTVVNTTTDAIFNATNDNTINTNTKYVCVLTFTEV